MSDDRYLKFAEWLRSRPKAVHIVITALMGKTGEHIREEHGLEPLYGGGDERIRANLLAHLAAHPQSDSEAAR